MKLTILHQDNSVEEINVTRVSNVSTKTEMLYYECSGDTFGGGKIIPLSDIKFWEIQENT